VNIVFDLFDYNIYYLDPVSGSYFIQITLAALVTVGVYARTAREYLIEKLKNIFKKKI